MNQKQTLQEKDIKPQVSSNNLEDQKNKKQLNKQEIKIREKMEEIEKKIKNFNADYLTRVSNNPEKKYDVLNNSTLYTQAEWFLQSSGAFELNLEPQVKKGFIIKLIKSTADKIMQNQNENKQKATGSIKFMVRDPENRYLYAAFNCISADTSVNIRGNPTQQIFLKRWNIMNKDMIEEQLDGHNFPVTSIKFSIDYKTIYTSSEDGSLIEWKSEKSEDLFKKYIIEADGNSINCMALLKNGTLITAHEDGKVQQRDSQMKVQKNISTADPIKIMVQSHDDKWLFLAGNSPNIYLMNTQTLELLSFGNGQQQQTQADPNSLAAFSKATYEAPDKNQIDFENQASPNVKFLALSQKSDFLYSAHCNGIIYQWDVKQKNDVNQIRERKISEETTSPMSCLYLSHDQKYIYSGYESGLILKVTLKDFEVFKLKGHTKKVNCLMMSDDKKMVFSGSSDNQIIKWNSENNEKTNFASTKDTEITSLVTDSQKNVIYANLKLNRSQHGVKKFKTDQRTSQAIFDIPTDEAKHIILTQDGKFAYYSTSNHQVWSLDRQKLKKQKVGNINDYHTKPITGLLLSKDESALYSSSEDSNIIKWQLRRPDEVEEEEEEDKNYSLTSKIANLFNRCRHKNRVYSNSMKQKNMQKKQIQKKKSILNKKNKKDYQPEAWVVTAEVFDGHKEGVTCMKLTEDGSKLFSGSKDNDIMIWNTKNKEFQIMRAHTDQINCLILTMDEKIVYSSSNDGCIRRWNIGILQSQVMSGPNGHTGPVGQIALSANEQNLFSISSDGNLKAWDTYTLECQKTIKGVTNKDILTMSRDRSHFYVLINFNITQFQTKNLSNKTMRFKGEDNFGEISTQLLLNRDSSILYAVSNKSKILRVDINNQSSYFSRKFDFKLSQAYTHGNRVQCLALSHDEQSLFSASDDKTIRLWELSEHYFKDFRTISIKYVKNALSNEPIDIQLMPKEEALYINVPQLMLHMEYTDEQIVDTAIKLQYLSIDYSLEQQQNWVFKLAMDENRTVLVYLIMDYYIKNPQNYNITGLDHTIETQLLLRNEPLTPKFLELIKRKQLKPNEKQARGYIRSGRESTFISKSFKYHNDIFPKTRNFRKKISTNQAKNPRELAFSQTGFTKNGLWGSNETILRLKALLQSYTDVILIYETEILCEWDKFAKYHKFRALIFWLMTYFCYIYANYWSQEHWHIGHIMLFNVGLLMAELKIAFSMGITYLKYPFNWLDIYVHFMVVYLVQTARDEALSERPVLVNTFTFFVMNIRSLIYLRAFQGPRYLIAMVLTVFRDFLPFMIIFASFIGFFSLSDIYLSLMDKNGIVLAQDVILENYLIALGDWDVDSLNIMRKTTFYFYSIVLTLVMMNLLIAVISATYADFSMAQQEYNLRELIDLTIEYHYLFQNRNSNKKRMILTIEQLGGYVYSKEYLKGVSQPGISTLFDFYLIFI